MKAIFLLLVVSLVTSLACNGSSSTKDTFSISSSEAYSVRTESNNISTQTFYYDDVETKFILDSGGMRSETRIAGELVSVEEF